ncbi:MAG: mechanosensitive ion channel family protein [Proteobacteria bacterium]|nr:mechanosensitive ion channel family protein [Pseudomonadota bacterium]
MENTFEVMKLEFLGIAFWVYLAAFGAILIGFIGKKIANIIFGRLIKAAQKTKIALDDILLIALAKPVEWAVVIGGIFVALLILPIPKEPIDIDRFVRSVLAAASVTLVIWFAMRLVDGLSELWIEKAAKTETKLDDQLAPIVRRSSKVFLFIIGIVLVLQNMGYSVGSLLAGLGIGGVAVAMAAKDTVANLFGSFVIFLDKPFQIGDWIEMGDVEGTVEEVGLRTTRSRTFANSVITIPNLHFTTTSINNWSEMKKRRIKMMIGVTYSTSQEKIQALVQGIRDIIEKDDKIHSDFYLVNFDNFGPSSLDIFVYCFTVTTKWGEFLDVKQSFMLKVMGCVEDLGLEFAFPTQTVHLESIQGEPEALIGQRPR